MAEQSKVAVCEFLEEYETIINVGAEGGTYGSGQITSEFGFLLETDRIMWRPWRWVNLRSTKDPLARSQNGPSIGTASKNFITKGLLMSSRSSLLNTQRAWAKQSGIYVDERGYVNSIAENLYQPLSSKTLQAFSSGSGSELQDTAQRPAKMKALHSSAALAVNFFEYWTTRNAEALLRAMGLSESQPKIEFEVQFPTGLRGIPPNLDLALRFDSGLVIGVESKFSEWLASKPVGKETFKEKYFPESIGLWTDRGLPGCQYLANEVQSGDGLFRYLDVAQLLKHALGLAKQHPGNIELFYVFFDVPGQESLAHSAEVNRFACAVRGDFQFRWSSYQDIFKKLAQSTGAEHRSYITYLGERYFPI